MLSQTVALRDDKIFWKRKIEKMVRHREEMCKSNKHTADCTQKRLTNSWPGAEKYEFVKNQTMITQCSNIFGFIQREKIKSYTRINS